MDAAKNGESRTGMVCGGNRPAGSHFHGVDRFGRMSFPDVDTGFIGWARNRSLPVFPPAERKKTSGNEV